MALHEDADMDAQLSRTLIGAYVGAADLGEAIATAQRAEPGDYAAWYSEWDRTATAATNAADRAALKGRSETARLGYLRAAEYRRQSYFFLRHDITDPRVQDAYRGQRDLFRRSFPFQSFAADPVSIPFDPVPLPGYMFRPKTDDEQPRPTVLIPGGFDGTCEEMFKYGAHSALAQGWNAVTWDGPGQGGLLIEHRCSPPLWTGPSDCRTCRAMPSPSSVEAWGAIWGPVESAENTESVPWSLTRANTTSRRVSSICSAPRTGRKS